MGVLIDSFRFGSGITNAQKLSLPANTAVGTRVSVTDGFVVSESGVDLNGFWFWSSAGNEYRRAFVRYIGDDSDIVFRFGYGDNGDQWAVGSNSTDFSTIADAPGENPWDATWTNSGLTLTHPAVQELTAPSNTLAAVFISGAGTPEANGIYTARGTNDGVPYFNLLGALSSVDDNSSVSRFTIDHKWYVKQNDAPYLYRSVAANVDRPWNVLAWENTDDDPANLFGSAPSPTASSVTQGEIDAGMKVTGAGTANANDVYPVTGNNAGKNAYTGIVHTLVLEWTGTAWKINNTSPQSATNSKIPSGASFNDSATVTRDDVASEANWQVVS